MYENLYLLPSKSIEKAAQIQESTSAKPMQNYILCNPT